MKKECLKCGKFVTINEYTGRIRDHACNDDNSSITSNGLDIITSMVYDDFTPSNYDSSSDNSSSSDTSSSDIGGGGDFGGAGSSSDF